MSKVDWSLAPNWATHALVKLHNPGIGGVHWSYFIDGEHRISPDGLWFHPDGYRVSEERPRNVKPKPWSGPEDGLPPVGSEVELGCDCIMARFDDFKLFEKGTRVLVGGHANFGGVDVAVIHREHDSRGYTATLCEYLEPICTPQQRAAEKRESAIRDVMDIAQVDCRVTAARLVDAGFARGNKKEEQGRDAVIDAMKSTFDSVSDQLVPTSNKYLETLFGALYDAGFKREVV